MIVTLQVTLSGGMPPLPVHPDGEAYDGELGFVVPGNISTGTAQVVYDLSPSLYADVKGGNQAGLSWVQDGGTADGDVGTASQRVDALYLAPRPIGASVTLPPAVLARTAYRQLALINANNAIWQIRANEADARTIHDLLVAVNVAYGAVAVVADWSGQRFKPWQVLNYMGWTKAEADTKRDIISTAMGAFGYSTTAIDAARDEDELAVGLAVALGSDRAGLFVAMSEQP